MIEAIRKRRSVRSYQSRPVEPEKIESILRAAMQSPSGMNGQPWEFVVVDDSTLLAEMKTLSPGARALGTAPVCIVVLEREVPRRVEMGVTFLSQQDLGACTENMLLQAVEEGLGAGWMGIGPGSDAQAKLAALLHLPPQVKPFCMVAVGYPAQNADCSPADRFDPARIHRNGY